MDIRSGQSKWLTLLITVIAYGITIVLLEPIIGPPLAVLMILPVTTAGWLFGLWGGLLLGVLSLPLNFFLFTVVGQSGLPTIVGGGGLFWHAGAVFVGVVTGRLRDLEERARKAEKSLEINEESLRKEETLEEQKVEERTKELRKEHSALEEAKGRVDLGYMQIQRERTRLFVSVNNLPVGFILTGTKGEVVDINDKAKKLLELNHVSEIGDVERKLSSSLDLHKALIEGVTTRKTQNFDEVVFGDKSLRIFLTPITMPHDHREFIGTAILIEDITAEKLLERSKDEFFAVAAHDMRTPLTAIRGNASMIMDYFSSQLRDKSLREMVSDIHKSSVRLIGLVNDYLDTAKLEQGKVEFHKETFNLTDLIDETTRQLENTATSKGLYLKLEKEEAKLPEVVADKNRTNQVIFNLIGNAIKFTEKGGVKVTVKNEDSDLAVRVIDTGSGISKTDQSLLFKKFQQADGKILTHDVTTGTGLGLYISKLMVEAMGGKICLESSEVDKGSTFLFTLPLVKS